MKLMADLRRLVKLNSALGSATFVMAEIRSIQSQDSRQFALKTTVLGRFLAKKSSFSKGFYDFRSFDQEKAQFPTG